MDEQFKTPLVVLMWVTVVVAVVFGILFIYGTILSFTDPLYYP